MRVAVNTEILDWALRRAGKTASDLEPNFAKINQWISGERKPTLTQLEEFAQKTSVPFGYLFLKEPPIEEPPLPLYRTVRPKQKPSPSPDFLDTVYSMQRRQLWLRDFLIDTGQEPLKFVGSFSGIGDELELAASMRIALEIKENWAAEHKTWEDAWRFLRKAMERAGVIVVINSVVGNNTHRKLNVSEFRGFVLVDEYAPLTFVNGADAKAAQMFTLSHELAHICIGKSAAFDLREVRAADDPVERACDKAAAEFLVPSHLLKEAWQIISKSEKPFKDCALRFKVSEIVAARRALDLKLISRQEFLNFYKEYRARASRDRGASGQKPIKQSTLQNMRVGKLFATNVILALMSGKVSYQDAYRLTGLNGKSFERYADSLGFHGV